MPLNSVQQYIRDQVNGLEFPITQQATLAAFIAPPNPGDQITPLCYVWGAESDEVRKTMPRGPGNKEITYRVDMWVYFTEDSDDELADSLFPVVIDTITSRLRTMQTNIQITDPQTGAESGLVAAGENIKVDYAPARTLATEALMQYMARIIVEVREWVRG